MINNLRNHPEFIQQLAEWHQAEWSHLNPGENLQQRIQRMQSYLDQNFISSMFIAHNKDKLLGSAAIVEHDMEIHKDLSPWLASVFVRPEYRNQGIGSQLVQYVTKLARANGFDRLYLYTEDKTAFYENLGWKPLSQDTYQGQNVEIMFF